jgi:hypothetical protein
MGLSSVNAAAFWGDLLEGKERRTLDTPAAMAAHA